MKVEDNPEAAKIALVEARSAILVLIQYVNSRKGLCPGSLGTVLPHVAVVLPTE
jgi:hypothetical protein